MSLVYISAIMQSHLVLFHKNVEIVSARQKMDLGKVAYEFSHLLHFLDFYTQYLNGYQGP